MFSRLETKVLDLGISLVRIAVVIRELPATVAWMATNQQQLTNVFLVLGLLDHLVRYFSQTSDKWYSISSDGDRD